MREPDLCAEVLPLASRSGHAPKDRASVSAARASSASTDRRRERNATVRSRRRVQRVGGRSRTRRSAARQENRALPRAHHADQRRSVMMNKRKVVVVGGRGAPPKWGRIHTEFPRRRWRRAQDVEDRLEVSEVRVVARSIFGYRWVSVDRGSSVSGGRWRKSWWWRVVDARVRTWEFPFSRCQSCERSHELARRLGPLIRRYVLVLHVCTLLVLLTTHLERPRIYRLEPVQERRRVGVVEIRGGGGARARTAARCELNFLEARAPWLAEMMSARDLRTFWNFVSHFHLQLPTRK